MLPDHVHCDCEEVRCILSSVGAMLNDHWAFFGLGYACVPEGADRRLASRRIESVESGTSSESAFFNHDVDG